MCCVVLCRVPKPHPSSAETSSCSSVHEGSETPGQVSQAAGGCPLTDTPVPVLGLAAPLELRLFRHEQQSIQNGTTFETTTLK